MPTLDTANLVAKFEAYAGPAMSDWLVPGLAVAIVHGDEPVHLQGYGTRTDGEDRPVDPDTLFAIASNTKAFTAAALGILVDEGKLKWDDKVSELLPGFQLSDPYASRELTVRDTLCHRSGLAGYSGDLLWYQSTLGREDLIRRMRHLKPASSFRNTYGYQNLMFLVAGQIIPAVAGQSWDNFLKDRLFDPLGMNRTNTSVAAMDGDGNVASPHNEVEGKLRKVPFCVMDCSAPAGAINSCARDLSQWLRLQLGRGELDGKTIFSKSVAKEMWAPQTIVPLEEDDPNKPASQHFSCYGLGWQMWDQHGLKVVSHGGALDGMASRTLLLPELHFGVAILTNSESLLSRALGLWLVDFVAGNAPRDWSADIRAQRDKEREAAKDRERKIDEARILGTTAQLTLDRFEGVYGGELFGEATVFQEDGKLVLRLELAPQFTGDLVHWHLNTFQLTWRNVPYPFPRGWVTFGINRDGIPDGLKMDLPNADFNFAEPEFKRKIL